jgi:hypothetical protein
MTELKTLKDLEEYLNSRDEEIIITLKQEATKWLTELINMNYTIQECSCITGWIKHFFNLTEKDLEDK